MGFTTNGFRIATVRGIEVRVHWSWLAIFLVLSWTLADTGFFGQYIGWPLASRWVLGLVTLEDLQRPISAGSAANSALGLPRISSLL